MIDEELIKQITLLQRQVDGLIKPEVGRTITFTPTVTQGVAVTCTISVAEYVIQAKVCHMEMRLAITSAGTLGQNIIVGGIPTIAGIKYPAAGLNPVGVCRVLDSGTAVYNGVVVDNNLASSVLLSDTNTRGYIGANPSFALANGDTIALSLTYFVS